MSATPRNCPGLLPRAGKLATLGASSFGLNLVLMFALTDGLGLLPELSFALVLSLLFVGNFLFTRHWVFKDRVDGSDARRQFARCLGVSCTFRLFEWFGFFFLENFSNLHYLFCVGGIMLVSFTLKTFVYDRYVFR